jgi:hypothetical protein
LSLRAISVVSTFSRAIVFNMRTSSFVHGRSLIIFFAIRFPQVLLLRIFSLNRQRENDP